MITLRNHVEEIEMSLSVPSPALVERMAPLEGDLLILGIGGKMGPTLALMARRACEEAGVNKRIIGVARFSEMGLRERLGAYSVETIKADLLDHKQLNELPDVANVIYLAGMKFGSSGKEALTWAMNCYLPGMVCERFSHSRIVALSSGNVYGLSPVDGEGSREEALPQPKGDYAMSCLGRERIFQHFSLTNQTPVALIRLNYAVEYRYGVLVDLARKVWMDEPVDLTMGYLNCIWQPDANAIILRALEYAASPATIFNLTGSRRLRVLDIAHTFGNLMGKTVRYTGQEAGDALLSDNTKATTTFGPPSISENEMIERVAGWMMRDGLTLNKPTKFEARDGRF